MYFIYLYTCSLSKKSILVLYNVILHRDLIYIIYIYNSEFIWALSYISESFKSTEQVLCSQWRPTIIFVFVFGICFGLMRLMGSSQVKDCHCWGLNLRLIKSWVNFGKVVAIYTSLFFLYYFFCLFFTNILLLRTLSAH